MIEEKNNKNRIILSSIIAVLLVLLVVGVTYAAYTITLGGENGNTIRTGQITMRYYEPTTSYVVENALPMGDNAAKDLDNYFEFTVTTHATTSSNDTSGLTIPYEINIIKESVSGGITALTDNQIKIYLQK